VPHLLELHLHKRDAHPLREWSLSRATSGGQTKLETIKSQIQAIFGLWKTRESSNVYRWSILAKTLALGGQPSAGVFDFIRDFYYSTE
jgi:hypothetical protein